MTEQELRESYERARSILDWDAIAGVFAAKRWVYSDSTTPPSARVLRETTDELFAICLREFAGGNADYWISSGRFKVSYDETGVTIDGQALVYLDKHSPGSGFTGAA